MGRSFEGIKPHKIDWPEAERLLGARVDRRLAFWKSENEVLVYGWHGVYSHMSQDEMAELWAGRLIPYRAI